MSSKNFKKGDTVMLLSGKDKGRKGKVLQVYAKAGKLVVENLNQAKKHTRPTQGKIPQPGGILDKPIPVPFSKVMVVCGKCNKPTRVTRFVSEGTETTRMCRKCGASLDK